MFKNIVRAAALVSFVLRMVYLTRTKQLEGIDIVGAVVVGTSIGAVFEREVASRPDIKSNKRIW